ATGRDREPNLRRARQLQQDSTRLQCGGAQFPDKFRSGYAGFCAKAFLRCAAGRGEAATGAVQFRDARSGALAIGNLNHWWIGFSEDDANKIAAKPPNAIAFGERDPPFFSSVRIVGDQLASRGSDSAETGSLLQRLRQRRFKGGRSAIQRAARAIRAGHFGSSGGSGFSENAE